MKLLVARHGQTVWNTQNKICGITDVELTEEGMRQAEKLAEIVRNYSIDVIVSSPMRRAIATSRIIAERNHIAIQDIQIENRLVEQNYGIFEGLDRKNEGFLSSKRNFAFRYPEGESMMQVAYRVYGVIEWIKEEFQGKNVLIVSHGGVCRVIRTYFRDMTNDEFYHYSPENCALEEYEL